MESKKKTVGKEGHRERIRTIYLSNPDAEMEDRALLELFLTYAIPRKDVKPIAYALLNEFNTLENIFNADIDALESINGIGKNSAILFNLFNKISKTIERQKMEKPKSFKNAEDIGKYIIRTIGHLEYERFIVLTFDNSFNLINVHSISDGNHVSANVDRQKLLRKVLNDKAVLVIIAHNHPHGLAYPSHADVFETTQILGILREMGIRLKDHIVVNSTEAFSMATDLDTSYVFD